MITLVVPVWQPQVLDQAAALIHAGHVVAVPTDTVYGLVCRYDHPAALDRLYRIKGRPPGKALPVLLGDKEQVTLVAGPSIPEWAWALMERFWPGALTLVLAAQPHLPSRLTAGGATVGVRLPDHEILRRLAQRTGPLASSSANLSGGPECTTPSQVVDQLDGQMPLLVDGGQTDHARASTVAAIAGRELTILREGPIAAGVLAFWDQLLARHPLQSDISV